ncbi:E3 ubiquitin-protein ligase TRIM39, partial [Varanus komodoensis]
NKIHIGLSADDTLLTIKDPPKVMNQIKAHLVEFGEVQQEDTGQYVCALTCDQVYKEAIMEVRVKENHPQNSPMWGLYCFVAAVLKEFNKLSSKIDELTDEMDKLRKHNDKLTEENDNLKKHNEKVIALEREVIKLNKEKAWRQARNNEDDITLDEASAHPNISVAVDKKSFSSQVEVLQVSPSPQRFDAVVAVLGSKGFSSGSHYWEVDISSSDEWDLGVARESIQRKGNISLSPKEGFWVLGLSGKDYWAKTDPWTRLIVQRKLKIIGICLNFQEKRLTFFNVSDMTVIFEFKDCAFSEAMYPFFKNTHRGTEMRICCVKKEEM